MFNRRYTPAAIVAGLLLPLFSLSVAAQRMFAPITWTFDRLDSIGGVATRVEGNPKVVDTPLGKAIQFNGVDDALV
jgi:hypothetical protein